MGKGDQMAYPQDETDLTSDEMDEIMADAEPVELAADGFQHVLGNGGASFRGAAVLAGSGSAPAWANTGGEPVSAAR